MSVIHTIKDVDDWEQLIEDGAYVMIPAKCEDGMAVSPEVAAQIQNGTLMTPTLCVICCHDWERESFQTWQDLQEMFENDEVTELAVRAARDEWRSAKVSLMNQMHMESAWTDEEENTALEPKMSARWMSSHQTRAGPALTINECPSVKEFKANEPLAGNKHEREEAKDERSSKRQRTGSSS